MYWTEADHGGMHLMVDLQLHSVAEEERPELREGTFPFT